MLDPNTPASPPVDPALTPSDAPAPVSTDPDLTPKKVEDYFLARIQASKSVRQKKVQEWKRNVEIRMGDTVKSVDASTQDSEDVQSTINPDWSLTKTKTANLFSQVPTVRITHESKPYAPAIPPFAKAINYEIGEKRANLAVAMEECLNDVVNAAGVAAIHVGYAARFDTVRMPTVDSINHPDTGTPIPLASFPQEHVDSMMDAGAIPHNITQRTVSDKFFGNRISPGDLLYPAEFIGSCFENADWIGHTGLMSWAEAKTEFKLTDDDKNALLASMAAGGDITDLRIDKETSTQGDLKAVKYDEIFYRRYKVDPEEKSFASIWRVVFVEGKDTAVIHEQWKGQKFDEQTRKYVGASKYPIQVLTLTYVSDQAIPPSDSKVGRPQVNDMRRSRSQMFQNREHSIPIRWYDSNRVDPLVQDTLNRGTWQGMIPTNGDGSRSIGEVARASYPSEDLSFDREAKADLMEMWQVGPNQLGNVSSGRHTVDETRTVQANFATRIGMERARVTSFFLNVVEVIAGLMALYSDFPILTDDERQQMQKAWDDKKILHDLVLKIRPDSSIVLDSQDRIERLSKFLNLTVKSGYVNPAPIIAEMAELSGIDPGDVMIQPQPKAPEEPNLSFRYTGKEDMMNPMVVAMLVHSKQAPSAEDITAAKALLVQSAQEPTPQEVAPPPPAGAGGPGGAPGMPPPGPGAPPPNGPPGAPPGPPGPPGPPHPPGPVPGMAADAHPQWSLGNRIMKRSRDAN